MDDNSTDDPIDPPPAPPGGGGVDPVEEMVPGTQFTQNETTNHGDWVREKISCYCF